MIELFVLEHNGTNDSQNILIVVDEVIGTLLHVAECFNIVVILHNLGQQADERLGVFENLLYLEVTKFRSRLLLD